MLRCFICGRALLREPAYSESAHGRAIHYGPKCAMNKGLIAPAGISSAAARPRRRRTTVNSAQMPLDLLDTQNQTA